MIKYTFPEAAELYQEVWSNFKGNFFKLEVMPTYDEFNIADWKEVDSGKSSELINQVQKDLHSQKEDYSHRFDVGMTFSRVRYIAFPISKYLLVELSSYATSQHMGVKIRIFEDAHKHKIPTHLVDYMHDFLLFGNDVVFKAINPNGESKCEFYISRDAKEIKPYIELKDFLESNSLKLDDYMNKLNLEFKRRLPDGL